MKRTFEISWRDGDDKHEAFVVSDIHLAMPNLNGVEIKEVLNAPSVPLIPKPPPFYPCPVCGRRTPDGTVCPTCFCNLTPAADAEAVAKAVVAESLEEMAKPYAELYDKKPACRTAWDDAAFAREAARLRTSLEPTPDAPEAAATHVHQSRFNRHFAWLMQPGKREALPVYQCVICSADYAQDGDEQIEVLVRVAQKGQ